MTLLNQKLWNFTFNLSSLYIKSNYVHNINDLLYITEVTENLKTLSQLLSVIMTLLHIQNMVQLQNDVKSCRL